MIGQRRARVSEYRPAPREQQAWTQAARTDEARELRAFDRLHDDSRGQGHDRKGRKPRGNRQPLPDDIGNRLTAPGGKKPGKPKRRKAAAPGFENPSEHRSWYVPEGVTTTSRVAPPRQVGRPGRLADGTAPRHGKPGGSAGPWSGKPGGQGPQAPKGRGKPAARGPGRPRHGGPRSNKPKG